MIVSLVISGHPFQEPHDRGIPGSCLVFLLWAAPLPASTQLGYCYIHTYIVFLNVKLDAHPFNAITRYVVCKHFNILYRNPFARVHIFTKLTKKQLNCSPEKASVGPVAIGGGSRESWPSLHDTSPASPPTFITNTL